MRRVQEALKKLGIPVWQDGYKKQDAQSAAASQYVTYVTETVEDEHYDDEAQSTRTYVYMNLWSAGNPKATAKMIRKAMKQAGFAMREERAGSTGSNGQYAQEVKMYCVSWTWVCWDVMEDGN